MEKLYINLDENSYWIYIGKGLLPTLGKHVAGADKILLITDENVEKYYGDQITQIVEGRILEKVILRPGEPTKNLGNVGHLLEIMLEKGLTRSSKVIALGGGVIGDIAGFTASIYMRGIDFIQVPTTLLAQVDSSVGGKTGVNLEQGKNMVGSFYQPKVVVIDIDLLKTLPHRELISGLGEIIKYGIIYDGEFFDYINENLWNLLALEETVVTKIIKRCCEIKAAIVSQDEQEMGVRKILNFGHTIGHGIEALTHYEKYTHGEAVILGMYYEAQIAKNRGYIDESYFRDIEMIIRKTGLDLNISQFILTDLLDAMTKDKKNKGGKISFILPRGKGNVQEVLLTPEELATFLYTYLYV
ncbi:3-dehydroquinate synthase [Alkaliphilus metalliredigens QYMF]|uniref:3-dehydroquinate synthase n=1 Tax=Alkaliphilus metalliredigens (strain QYMF) TaxID=293826 RepID=AROB_ALKMQ|nr:3-dehydroquinate synthase [Alkaliphilus metalliredigens]A6TL07.1 RecName: Full=3-dehydroquinate synthase; Short=DHQS [Alkaliphilus metalliredigens QYMF]ABR46875.1 3-dehydroquinate synthase [Alkaliphilus metalliredigens QYMF]